MKALQSLSRDVKTYNPMNRHRPIPLALAPLVDPVILPSTGYALYIESVAVLLRLRVPRDEGNVWFLEFVSHSQVIYPRSKFKVLYYIRFCTTDVTNGLFGIKNVGWESFWKVYIWLVRWIGVMTRYTTRLTWLLVKTRQQQQRWG